MRNDIEKYRTSPALTLGCQVRKALGLLLNAADYSEDLGRDFWDFALTIRELRAVGLSDNDLRWLACKGVVKVALETTEPGEVDRAFRPAGHATLSDRACFILAEEARAAALALIFESTDRVPRLNGREAAVATPSEHDPVVAADAVPVWDRDRQELRCGGQVVKQFKVPSPNQETILAAFEEEHWPARIDDPLPPQNDQDPKRRLHDTINTLKRHQKAALIRFLGDGSGQGVRWEPRGRHAAGDGAAHATNGTAHASNGAGHV